MADAPRNSRVLIYRLRGVRRQRNSMRRKLRLYGLPKKMVDVILPVGVHALGSRERERTGGSKSVNRVYSVERGLFCCSGEKLA